MGRFIARVGEVWIRTYAGKGRKGLQQAFNVILKLKIETRSGMQVLFALSSSAQVLRVA